MASPPAQIVLFGSFAGTATALGSLRVGRHTAAIGLGLVVAIFCVADGSHFIRVALGDLSRFLWRRKQRSLKEEDRAKYIVGPWDVDRNKHMNNAKFIRIGNYARRSFWANAGVWNVALANRVNLIVTATTIRYRRELRLFTSYQVISRLIYWDDKCFYSEHKFVVNNFVHAVQLVKYRVVGGQATMRMPRDLLSAVDPGLLKEGPPSLESMPELKAWIEYDHLSSIALRSTNQLDNMVTSI
uniref:Thioesterase domain-containing protein n=1 Tax=Aureoumbra lagunensis TaxID=44058 RepID=A0A7S3JQF6_9STRA